MFTRSLKIAILAAPFLCAGMAMADSIAVLENYPTQIDQKATDEALTGQLTGQGFQDVTVMREDGHVQVIGYRENEQLTLTYDANSGQLLEADGKSALMHQLDTDSMTGHGSPGSNG